MGELTAAQVQVKERKPSAWGASPVSSLRHILYRHFFPSLLSVASQGLVVMVPYLQRLREVKSFAEGHAVNKRTS